jgi:5-methyltetrahydrofolate--homocysteine methyltransferase
MSRLLDEIYRAVLDGNRSAVTLGVRDALAEGLAPQEILAVMTRSMQTVGELFQKGEYFVPEMLVAARAMQHGTEVLRPHLVGTGSKPLGTVVAGTVRGDLHEMGKNLVCMLLECAGFRVLDVGMDVSPGDFVEAVRQNQPEIVALSALLTTTMPNMEVTIRALTEASLRQRVKVIVGGAPVTEAFAQGIGADGYARDASLAVDLAKRLIVANQD